MILQKVKGYVSTKEEELSYDLLYQKGNALTITKKPNMF